MKRTFVLFVVILAVAAPAVADESQAAPRIDGYHEFNYGQVAEDADGWVQAIRVSEPELRSEVRGDVTVKFRAPGMTRATALCWRQTKPPNHWGQDTNLTPDGIALDAEGDEVPGLAVAWSVPGEDQSWRSKKGRDWGFKHANLTLQTGYLQLGGRLSVTGIPYKQYDVYVYLGADADQGSGSVTMSSPSSGDDSSRTCYYWKRWLDGLFVASQATTLEKTEPSNCVVFEENAAAEFTLEWKGNLKGGWTGVSGVQIVERP